MTFKCLKCGKITEKVENRVRCPFCGFRVFSKQRPKVIRRVNVR